MVRTNLCQAKVILIVLDTLFQRDLMYSNLFFHYLSEHWLNVCNWNECLGQVLLPQQGSWLWAGFAWILFLAQEKLLMDWLILSVTDTLFQRDLMYSNLFSHYLSEHCLSVCNWNECQGRPNASPKHGSWLQASFAWIVFKAQDKLLMDWLIDWHTPWLTDWVID